MNVESSSQLPPQELERRAAEQRQRIHRSVGELKDSLTELKSSVRENIRERLDPQRIARKHLWQLAAGASAIALFAGYGVAGMFTRR